MVCVVDLLRCTVRVVLRNLLVLLVSRRGVWIALIHLSELCFQGALLSLVRPPIASDDLVLKSFAFVEFFVADQCFVDELKHINECDVSSFDRVAFARVGRGNNHGDDDGREDRGGQGQDVCRAVHIARLRLDGENQCSITHCAYSSVTTVRLESLFVFIGSMK